MSSVQNPQQKSPEANNRDGQRRVWSGVLIAIGLFLAWVGVDYVIFDFIPVPVFGLLLSGLGVLGLLGVNVFAGGPLDRNRDPR